MQRLVVYTERLKTLVHLAIGRKKGRAWCKADVEMQTNGSGGAQKSESEQLGGRYYDLPFVKASFDARLRAVESVVPPNGQILDLGCNDGRIALHLLSTGLANRVTAVDVEDFIVEKPQNLVFIGADLKRLDLRALKRFDLVLALNVVHHVVAHSRAIARDIVRACLEISDIVLVEMGSFTEHGLWHWRREFDRYWRTDTEMWDDLFGSAPRRAVLRYPAMGGGYRVIWRLQGNRQG